MQHFTPTLQSNHKLRIAEREIIIFGAGTLGRDIAKTCHDIGLNVVAFADETPAKNSIIIEGVIVLYPSELIAAHPNALWMVCIFQPRHSFLKTREKLLVLGVKDVCSFYEFMRAYPEENLPKYFFDKPENYDLDTLYELRDQLIDNDSKDALNAFIRLVLIGDFACLPYHTIFQQSPITISTKTSFIDAGAYNGDTLEAFITTYGQRVSNYLALEPDCINFEQLQKKVSDLNNHQNIKSLNVALWREDGIISFDSHGNTASAINIDNTEGNKVATRSIDSLWAEFKLEGDVVLKLDIEGAEFETLRSAKMTISKNKPTLMISVYHKPHDLSRLYSLIKSFRQDYQFALRYHANDGSDLILYCL